MAPERRTSTNNSALRHSTAVPERRHVQPQYKPRVTKETRRNRQRAYAIDRGYLFVLGLAMLATLFMCVSYLSVQATVTHQKKQIAIASKELSTLVDENNATLERLNSKLNLNYVYNVATKKLGMVHAGESQIIYYDSSSPDYLRQYKEIPAN